MRHSGFTFCSCIPHKLLLRYYDNYFFKELIRIINLLKSSSRRSAESSMEETMRTIKEIKTTIIAAVALPDPSSELY